MTIPGYTAEFALNESRHQYRVRSESQEVINSELVTPQFWYCHALGIAAAAATGNKWIGFSVHAGCVLAHFV